jgi:hypothetical protein
MAGLKGKTNNKLFRVKSVDTNEPFKVGLNGVISINTVSSTNDINIKKIKYNIDAILYTSFIEEIPQKEIYSLNNLDTEKIAEVINYKKTTTVQDTNVIDNQIKGTNKVQKFTRDKTKEGENNLNKSIKKVRTFNFDLNGELREGEILGEANNINTDTIFETDSLSFDSFTEEKIYKEEKYIGLISDPIIESEVFMERDISSVFERHQRLSEIEDINQLEIYRNGYYKTINTI